MASAFIVEERRVRGPATHAVVIGVGHYSHLPGGGARRVLSPEGLTQLTSPPVSARRFATWLIDAFNHPSKPLATVALLLSERSAKPFRNPRTGVDHAVQRATIDNIEAALTEWRGRGDRRPGQRLIFYFCGHGMGKGTDVSLLAADYGAKPLNPLDGAIDFRYFKLAMSHSKAADQVYFVDACRVHSGSLLRAGQVNGRWVFTDDLLAPPNPDLLAPVFYATLPGVAAWGREREVSAYTEALLSGLQGAGAVDNGQGWRVIPSRLNEALAFHLERAMKQIGRAQVPVTDNEVRMDLHFPTDEPLGTALVACDDPQATAAATLTVTGRGQSERRPRTSTGEWILELRPGTYEFRAEFAGGRWRAEPTERYIQPVYMNVSIRATR